MLVRRSKQKKQKDCFFVKTGFFIFGFPFGEFCFILVEKIVLSNNMAL